MVKKLKFISNELWGLHSSYIFTAILHLYLCPPIPDGALCFIIIIIVFQPVLCLVIIAQLQSSWCTPNLYRNFPRLSNADELVYNVLILLMINGFTSTFCRIFTAVDSCHFFLSKNCYFLWQKAIRILSAHYSARHFIYQQTRFPFIVIVTWVCSFQLKLFNLMKMFVHFISKTYCFQFESCLSGADNLLRHFYSEPLLLTT